MVKRTSDRTQADEHDRKTPIYHESRTRHNFDHRRRNRHHAFYLEPPLSIQQCSQQWRVEKKFAADIAKNSIERRDKELKERIRQLEQEGSASDRETATIIRRLKKAENLKQLWTKLKTVRNKDRTQGVVRLEIPQDETMDPKQCTEWKVIDVPTEIVRHLQQRNRKHFGQAHGTPFTIPPLSDQLGFSGDGEAANEILTGTYDAATLNESVQLLICLVLSRSTTVTFLTVVRLYCRTG